MPRRSPSSGPLARPLARLATWFGVAALESLAALTGGCEPDPQHAGTDPFTDALPTHELFAIGMPGRNADDSAGAALSTEDAALVGEASQLEAVSFDAVVLLRRLLRDPVLDFERAAGAVPRVKSDTRRVWFFDDGAIGPASPQDLIVMERTSDGDYQVSIWLRELRPLQPQSKEWRFLAAAIVTPSGNNQKTRGTLWVDLEADRSPRSRGMILVTWTHNDSGRDAEFTLYGASPDDASDTPESRALRAHRDRSGGYLAFDAGHFDVHQDGIHSEKEAVRVYTRWNAKGRLRGDFTATGPDVSAANDRALLGSECWHELERVVLYESRAALPMDSDTPHELSHDGDPSACPFGLEKPPILPDVGPPPPKPVPPPETDPSIDWSAS